MSATRDQHSYDELPYLVRSYAQSAPDRLATLARLHGLITPPVTACRVLELGCAAGGNIIPLAHVLPESTFVGIDAAAEQIAHGRDIVTMLGLQNITLEHMSLLEIADDFGQFDYIIAHGIYSWVPVAVREHLLTICKHNLVPNGVAYISYNTYPGWSVLVTIRDALLYHTRGIADPHQRVTSARSLLNFLATADGDYTVFTTRPVKMAAQFFQQKVDALGVDGDTYLLHELLEEINEPLYFSQFVTHAAHYGLQYLCEAQLSDSVTSDFPRPVVQAITDVATDMVDLGQYMDFLRDQTFRQTLLCHDDVPLDRQLNLQAVLGLFATSRAVPDADVPDSLEGHVAYFRDEVHNIAFATEHPVTREALLHLSQRWPQAVLIGELLAAARTAPGVNKAGQGADLDTQVLAANLLRAYSYSKELASLHTFAPAVAASVSDRPIASPVARIQAQQRSYVTNQYHEQIALDPTSRYLLPLLDGSRDWKALLQALAGVVTDGKPAVQQTGGGGADADPLPPDAQLTEALAMLRHSALLVG